MQKLIAQKKMKLKVISDIISINFLKGLDISINGALEIESPTVDQFIPEIHSGGEYDFLLVHLTSYAFNTSILNEKYVSYLKEIMDGFTAGNAGAFGDLIHLDLIRLAFVGKEENVGMCRGREEHFHKIFLFVAHCVVHGSIGCACNPFGHHA